jgi:hypothetical protein
VPRTLPGRNRSTASVGQAVATWLKLVHGQAVRCAFCGSQDNVVGGGPSPSRKLWKLRRAGGGYAAAADGR